MGAINFNDVYANAYIRESVETLVTITIHQYPMLAGYEDEIRQDLWLAISQRLSRFDSKKSTIDTFCRRIINNAMKDIRRRYFTNKSIFVRDTVEINSVITSVDSASNDVEHTMLIADVRAVVITLPPDQRAICEMLMNGYPIRKLVSHYKVSVALFYKMYLNPIKEAFIRAGLKK